MNPQPKERVVVVIGSTKGSDVAIARAAIRERAILVAPEFEAAHLRRETLLDLDRGLA